MHKLFFSYKVLLLTVLAAVITTLFLVPFIEAGASWRDYPCPPSPQFQKLCNLDISITLVNLMQKPQRIDIINWNDLIYSFVALFIFWYGEIQGFLYVIKVQKVKSKKVVFLVKKGIVLAVMIIAPIFFVSLIESLSSLLFY